MAAAATHLPYVPDPEQLAADRKGVVEPLSDTATDGTAILCLDFESVPDPHHLAAEYENGGDFKKARQMALAGADPRAIEELLGESCKLGNRKDPIKILEYVERMEQNWESSICKTLSVDPLRCALVSVAIYTETIDPDDAAAGPQGMAVIASWGVDASREGESTEAILGRKTGVTRLRCVEVAKPLADMTPEEQYAAEHKLLLWTWAVLAPYAQAFAARQAILVTYNGARFDLRAMMWRSTFHRLPLTDPTTGETLPGVRPTVNLRTPRFATRPHMDVMGVVTDWQSNNYCSLEAAMGRMQLPFTKPDGWNGAAVYPAALEGNWEGIESYNLPDAATLYPAARLIIEGGLE